MCVYIYVLYLSQNKQRLLLVLTGFYNQDEVFAARY